MLTIEVSVWQLLAASASILASLVAAGFGLLRVLMRQLDNRFAAQELAREEGRKHWDARFAAIEESTRTLEREHLELRAELPKDYVRREDSIRETAVVHAKLDALATRIEMLALKMGGPGGSR